MQKSTTLKLSTVHFGHAMVLFYTERSMHTLYKYAMINHSDGEEHNGWNRCCIKETSFHTYYPGDDANTLLGQVVVNLLWIELTCINFRSVAETLNMSPTFSRSLFPFFIPYLCGLRAHNFCFLFPATFQHLHIFCAANEPDAPPMMTMYGFITV